MKLLLSCLIALIATVILPLTALAELKMQGVEYK